MANEDEDGQGRSSGEPGTLIGWYLLALVLDDHRRISVYRALLKATGWHHSSSVIVPASVAIVQSRWPNGASDGDVEEAIKRANASVPNQDPLDIDVAKTLVERALPREDVMELIVQAESAATELGYAPTTISSLAGTFPGDYHK